MKGRLSLSGTVKLASGETRSFTVREDAKNIVIRLNSSEAVVGCLTVQFDGEGRPFPFFHLGIDLID